MAGEHPPADLTCPVCSKPIRAGSFVQSEHGELFHIHCRSRQLQLRALEQVDRAQAAHERAAQYIDAAKRRRQAPRGEPSATPQVCPVCGQVATVTDWRPRLNWVVVEHCQCTGFFVWGVLWDDGRLTRLLAEDRSTLSRRIQSHRATRSEAWLTTRNGTVSGALIIRDERHDRPT